MKSSDKIIALSLLGIMFGLMFFSSINESATFDEVAHIPAGYSYLTEQDYRLNPEHPPLIKDISAIPLLFLNLNFPIDTPTWIEHIDTRQWNMGKLFLYKSGNDPDKILLFSRLPIILLALILGWFIFKWAGELYGAKTGLMTLFLYSMSPTIIAHSRYVTTDLGATFGFFMALTTFINFLRNPTKKNIVFAGIAFGIAQLLKFSTLILVPIYIILAILWAIIENYGEIKKTIFNTLKIIGKMIFVGLISLAVIIPVYQFHIKNYPPQMQANDIQTIFNEKIFITNSLVWLSEKPATRALGEYLFGVAMVLKRSGGGNNAYFNGEVSSSAWPSYFPILYFTKEQIAFHILTLMALFLALKNIFKSKNKNIKSIVEWMRNNFAIITIITFISVYLLQAITGNLNIGVRHIMPTLPFIYFLTSRQIIKWLEGGEIKKKLIVGALIILFFASTISTFPHYLSYYNFFGGGIKNGYKIATDSNYDWGQDFKYLEKFVKNPPNGEKIEKIAIDYFGGANPEYYLGEKYEPWWSSKGPLPDDIKWLAVSANSIMGSQAKPVRGFQQKYEDTYWWLKDKKPYARAGTSIFIYKF